MKPRDVERSLIAIEASRRAVMLTSRPGEGRVHSVFRRCFNMVRLPSDWLTVAVAPFPRVPDGIIVTSPHCLVFSGEDLVPGAVVRWSADVLSIPDAGLAIRLVPVRVFDTRRKPVAKPLGKDRFARNLAAAWETLDACGCAEGLGWARTVLRRPGAEALRAARECPDALCRRAVPSIVALLTGIRSNDATVMCQEIEQLIGFGIGLTPSGDDVLGGIAAGLFLGGISETQRRFVSILRDTLRKAGRTTEISAQGLSQIAAGEIADIIYDVAFDIAEQDGPEVVRAVMTLLSYGGSSGTEITLGLCLGLELAAELGGPCHQNGGFQYAYSMFRASE